jgi:transcriptional antiterminator RfaH
MYPNACEHPLWYVIHTHPKQEERTNSNLRAWNIETLAPRIREHRYNQFSGKKSIITKPLFSRYIFARFPLNSMLHKIRYTRGVQGVVSIGNEPTTVDNEVIDLIRARINDDGFVQFDEEFKNGDKVMITAGPLKNFTGIFMQETNDSDRVMLLLKTVNYQAHMNVERQLIRKIG